MKPSDAHRLAPGARVRADTRFGFLLSAGANDTRTVQVPTTAVPPASHDAHTPLGLWRDGKTL